MLDGHQHAFGPADLAPERRLVGEVRRRVVQRLVAEDRPAVVLVLDAPVGLVRAHERQVRAGGEGGIERVAHSARPVLVVACDHHHAVLHQARRRTVGVDVGLVRDVGALPLEEADELDLPPHRGLRQPAERPVERDAIRARAHEVVQALAAPVVVGLPCVDGDLDQDAGAAL